jgi:predicted TIM-barrel enzyme
MAEAGAHLVGAMLGVTAGGSAGSEPARQLEEGIEALAAMVEAVRATRPDALVLIHGGPLNAPDAVAQALERTGADGYVAGSTVERVPAIRAIAEAVATFREAAASRYISHSQRS